MDFSIEVVRALQAARHLVIFSGAGLSQESGIPTFRDALTGLWENFDAESLATPEAFERDRDLVWGWYEWRRSRVLGCSPNAAHHAVAELVRKLPRVDVVTQNVDDLLERAGCPEIIHLHGSIHRPYCENCKRPHALPPGIPDEPPGGRRLEPPTCEWCGGWIRPGVVWFGESLPATAWERAANAASSCDLMLCIGTSSMVYPAASLPRRTVEAGGKVIQINPQPTPLDELAQFNLRGKAGVILPLLCAATWDNTPGRQLHDRQYPNHQLIDMPSACDT